MVFRPREAMAERDLAVCGHAHQADARAARIRLRMPVMELLQRLANVREAVMPVLQRRFEKVPGEIAELRQQMIEAAVRDRVITPRRRGNRRKADFPEAELLGEMVIDLANVQRLLRQGHPGADRTRSMPGEQRLDLRRRNGVAAGAVVEDAELVLHLLRTVDRDGHANALVGKELDHVRPEQRGVGGQAEVDVLARFSGALPRIRDRRLQHVEIHQRLAAEKRDVRARVVARLAQGELDGLAGRRFAHELGLLAVLGVDNLVLAVLVAVGAGEVALVGDVHDQRL